MLYNFLNRVILIRYLILIDYSDFSAWKFIDDKNDVKFMFVYFLLNAIFKAY